MKRLALTIPQSYAELTDKELVAVSKILLQKNASAEVLQTQCLCALCGITIFKTFGNNVIVYRGLKWYLLKDWQLNEARKMLSWINETVSGVKPLSKLRGFAPVMPAMQGTPFVQYLASENYFQNFIAKGDINALQMLIATMYPPKSGFADHKTVQHARRFRKCSAAEFNTVFLWYISLKTVLANNFKNLFDTTGGAVQSVNMRVQIDNMLYSLSDGDITKHPNIYSAETWSALSALDRKALEYKQMKEQMNAKK